MTTPLHTQLRSLLITNTLQQIHSALDEIMREEYEFLSAHFEKKHGNKHAKKVVKKEEETQVAEVVVEIPDVVVAVPAPTQQQQQQQVQTLLPSQTKGLKIVVKKEEPAASAPEAPAEPIELEIEEVSWDGHSQEEKKAPTAAPAYRSPQEMKKWQREEEQKKRKELDSLGLSIDKLLTKDNLKKWIEEEGHTFAWVARERVGCPETQVSSFAKTYGIKSQISKRRSIIGAQGQKK